ncbi:hypothetical protein [Sporomusa sp.]|nr:hypothetical protein [Sporomusa sp.]HWR41912.1 hypothetical protein [Sporomusa sp.]
MHWLLMRPAVSWGAFLLVHAIGIPLVYGLGKACGVREANKEMIHDPEHL